MRACLMKSFLTGLAVSACAVCTLAIAGQSNPHTPGALGANDSMSWSQLGPDGSAIVGPFTALSALGVVVTGNFDVSPPDNQGLVAVVCPGASVTPTCSWVNAGPGFNAGDTLLGAFTPDGIGSDGTGPLSLSFSSPVEGVGAWFEAEAYGTYTGAIEAFDGSTLLGAFGAPSDQNGDPVFNSILETSPIITSVEFATSCMKCYELQGFGIDTLLMTDQAPASVPEPSSLFLFAGGLVGVGWRRFAKRSA